MALKKKFKIIDSFIDFIDWEECIEQILNWGHAKESRTVFLTSVHGIISAKYDLFIKKILNSADLSLPDGLPLTWLSYLCGNGNKTRISGHDLMSSLIEKSSQLSFTIFFYGSTNEVLDLIKKKISDEYQNIKVFTESPPFRQLTEKEDAELIERVNLIKPNLFFVGLGHPKQEKWIFEHKNKINSVMIAVGAAFDFYSNKSRRAPIYLQKLGLEWLYRLIQNPRKLFKRYFIAISSFMFFAFIQIFLQNSKTLFNWFQKIF
tara:strand:- start:5905 stop:6690 length:786 start_codon:yes stop_codon:yes gene_type:complete